MDSTSLRKLTSELIRKYKSFNFGNASTKIPYFNNKNSGKRAGLRVEIGKGNPTEIYDLVKETVIRKKVNKDALTHESLKRFLVTENIGIDCSGFAYHVLNEEGKSRGLLDIKNYLNFSSLGFLGQIKSKIRTVENTGVKIFANNDNSHVVEIRDVKVGDFISMVGTEGRRDHMVIISQIEYDNFSPKTIHYVHSIAWPTDGEYDHGFHEGKIEIVDLNKSISEQKWIENGKTSVENYTLVRARDSVTEIRRLNWFS